ncbi:hypothetical protein B0J17DRAFT_178194 [Rhizoctonia solani]|nr:hypothetical protein B0J17DRAFT_178194 [Rhizoctonia solani]
MLNWHPVHSHPMSNIILQASSVLFRVHRDTLLQHSGVFGDMFDLASAENAEDSSVAPSGNSPSMVLYDNSDELAILFYFLYRYPVDYENTKNCLQPTLLAHKYDISNLVGICRNQITSQLSGDDSSDGYEAVLKYRRDRTLIPLALRAAQLVEIPNIIPWALYMLSVQLDSDHYLFEQSEQDSLLVQCYAAAIHKLRNLFSKLIDWWNDEAAKFMGGDCEADDWDCARSESGEKNPIWKMWKTLQNSSHIDLCPCCEDDWSEFGVAFMERVLEDIRDAARSP